MNQHQSANYKNVVLFGGTSEEKLVSVATAQNLTNYLVDSEFWFWTSNDTVVHVSIEDLRAHQNPFTVEFFPKNATQIGTLTHAIETLRNSPRKIFNGLHGGRGENGWLQSLCEKNDVFLTGSRSASSALCMDKPAAKKVVRSAGGKVADEFVFETKDAASFGKLKEFWMKHKSIVVKPTSEGSSRGLYMIHDLKAFEQCASELKKIEMNMIAEQFISGRELTVGVLNYRGATRVIACSEVVLERGANFDYEGKYLGKGSVEITPADLTPQEVKSASELALLVHSELGCHAYSRSEMIFDDSGYYFLETNTLPGLTKASFIPQQLASAGISMQEFIDELLK